MSVAVIQTGGKQYLVREGDEVAVEKLDQKPDTTIELADLLSGKKVVAKVLHHDRAAKVKIVKFRAKSRYLRRKGHRQSQTHLKIESIK